jgi:glycosyltransferase involved in cell wall biosynthesis
MSFKDYTLPVEGTIHRAGMYPPYPIKKNNLVGKIYNKLWSDYLCLVDPFSGWILPSLLKGMKIDKNKKIDLIIATCPPFSSMVIGFLLSLVTNSKLILDYRDPWTNMNRKYCRFFGKKINRFFERVSIRHACALVFCSKKMKENFIDDLGKHTKATCHVINNGFFNRDKIRPLSLGKTSKNIVYAGKLYGQRKISLLARPLLQLLNEGLISKDTFCFHVFGKLSDEDREVIDKYGLSGLIKERSPVFHEQLIRYLKSADILVLIIDSNMSYSISYKFYDYLSVKKPILAIVPENSGMADLMSEIDCGRLASINNEESILTNLRNMLSEEKKYTFYKAEDYTWEKLGRKYLEVIDGTLAVKDD